MRIAALATTLLTGALVAAAPARATDMAAHRALYELTLDQTRQGDVIAAKGRMAYEVADACDGWAVRQRLELTVTNREGQDIEMVSDYATWEAKDGLSFRFHMKQTTDTAVTSQTDGQAKLERTGGPGQATYTQPHDQTKALPAGTLFPMAHTEAILAAAKAGKKFLAVPLFDGTVEAGAQDSFVTILNWHEPEKVEWPVLSALPSTRVHIAFFDRDAAAQTPDYEVGMRYWDNGIADALNMDFGDFVVNGRLADLTLPPPHC
jgi:hypothetical protein